MNVRLIEKIDSNSLREMCIKNQWFTLGDNEAYSKFLKMYDGKNPTSKRIAELAEQIEKYSTGGMDILDIMSTIYAEGVFRYVD